MDSLGELWALRAKVSAAACWFAVASACSGPTTDGGQTGSSEIPDGPKIPPGEGGPVRFGPSPAVPAPTGPNEGVEVPGVPSALLTTAGNTLYVADATYGVRRYDVTQPLEPKHLEPSALAGGASWVSTVGEQLLVLGLDVALREGFDRTREATILRRGPIVPHASSQQLDEVLSIPGVLLEAQRVDERLLVLTRIAQSWTCVDVSDALQPGLLVTEIELDSLQVGFQSSYPAFDGFMSGPGAFLLTQGTGPNEVQLITFDREVREYAERVVDAPSGVRDALEFFKVDESWVLRHLTREPLKYAFVELGETDLPTKVIELPWVDDLSYDGIAATSFGRYTVFTPTARRTSDQGSAGLGPGVVVDWYADGGPQVAFEVPTDWRNSWVAGNVLVAETRSALQVFALSDAGIELIGEPVVILGDEGSVWDTFWDAERAALWVKYFGLDNSGDPSSIIQLGRLDMAETPTWVGSIAGVDIDLQHSQLDDVTYAFERASPSAYGRAGQVLAADLEHRVVKVMPAVEHVDLDLAMLNETLFSLSYDTTGGLEVAAGSAALRPATSLTHRATELVTVGDKVLAVGLNPTNECYPETQGQTPNVACDDAGRAAITVVHNNNDDEVPTVQSTLLPPFDVTVPAGVAPPVVEWMELAAGQRNVGLLQHRGYVCHAASECEALGVPLVDGTGQKDETWFYAFDVDQGMFAEPIQLPSRSPNDRITTRNLVGDDKLRFMHFVETQRNSDGAHSDAGIVNLLTLEDGKHTSVTLDGYPMFVHRGIHVVTVRPTVALGSDMSDYAPVAVNVLELYEGAAYRVSSVEVGKGLSSYTWAQQRGALLLRTGEGCDRATTLVSLEYNDGEVRELGRLDVLGESWTLVALSDERAVMSRGSSPVQYVELALTNAGPEQTGETILAKPVPVVIDGTRVVYGRY
jgi:hypothetical protein